MRGSGMVLRMTSEPPKTIGFAVIFGHFLVVIEISIIRELHAVEA
jgi:hypothetical protein